MFNEWALKKVLKMNCHHLIIEMPLPYNGPNLAPYDT
jgi:hypothetical protein